MAEHDVADVPVTTSARELIGLLIREDVERESTGDRRTKEG